MRSMRKQRGFSRATQGQLAPGRSTAPRDVDIWKRPKRPPEVRWILAGLVALGLVGGWFLLQQIRGEGDAAPTIRPTASAGASHGAQATPSGVPGGDLQTASFPRPAVGTRIELKVLSLGDNPEACKAASLRMADDLRTVYHYDCVDSAAGPDAYFFLVRLRNPTEDPVPVSLSDFGLSTAAGGTRPPAEGSSAGGGERKFPSGIALGADASVKGWVTFDGGSGYRPASLSFVDGKQKLTVRFPDAWV
jgi:hypothetical protein